MHRRPERYNSKARQSTAGPSHKKGKIRNKQTGSTVPEAEPVDVNSDILTRKTTEAREADKRERLRRQVRFLSVTV